MQYRDVDRKAQEVAEAALAGREAWTPGPWERDGTIMAPGRHEIDLRLDEAGVNWITIKGDDDATVEANAALVRGAPDLAATLAPFARFIERFDAKPIGNLDDVFYAIHQGTEWAAELRLSDLRKAAAVLAATAGEKP